MIGALIGGMAQSAHESGSTTYEAEYVGLEGKSYAVVVEADRVIQADYPGVAERIAAVVNGQLASNAGASGHVPTQALLRRLLDRPQWRAWTREQLANDLGVERLVVIEVYEYRLHEPGNRYLWNGIAAGRVSVYESDGPTPTDASFDKDITVGFPDQQGVLTEQLPMAAVNTELTRRFSQRVAWLFYEHDEPNAIEY